MTPVTKEVTEISRDSTENIADTFNKYDPYNTGTISFESEFD